MRVFRAHRCEDRDASALSFFTGIRTWVGSHPFFAGLGAIWFGSDGGSSVSGNRVQRMLRLGYGWPPKARAC